jgi:hypothetical protein
MGRDGLVNFKDRFSLSSNGPGTNDNLVNFIEEGPASDIDIDLSINEYDRTLRSSIDFSEPESFKALMLPLGLEELRTVLQYELVTL